MWLRYSQNCDNTYFDGRFAIWVLLADPIDESFSRYQTIYVHSFSILKVMFLQSLGFSLKLKDNPDFDFLLFFLLPFQGSFLVVSVAFLLVGGPVVSVVFVASGIVLLFLIKLVS